MKTFDPQKIRNYIYITIGSAGGLGLSPIMPGTFGALLGVFFHLLTASFLPGEFQRISLIIFFVLVCAANHLLTPWAETYWKCRDPGQFVLDEVAGYLLVAILFRDGELWKIIVWGFILFRVFDIIKIPPARQIDRNFHGPWGILLDDLVSAGYAVGVMYAILWIRPDWLKTV
jgi:phosphatidylglycerophosphatase A